MVNSVYNWGGANAEIAASAVNQVKDHPAILMWSVSLSNQLSRLAPLLKKPDTVDGRNPFRTTTQYDLPAVLLGNRGRGFRDFDPL